MLQAIGFDADDTLWHNETIFVESHRKFAALLSRHHDAKTVEDRLFATEMRNLDSFGYGVKGFALSAIETAIELTQGEISGEEIKEILEFARQMLAHPVELLEGARETVETLARHHTLILITKGDLRDQERKIARSGLGGHFNHVEILSAKTRRTFERILDRHGIASDRFLMVGNSLKSDVLPVLELGGFAAHIPYPVTWAHEEVAKLPKAGGRFFQLSGIRELPRLVAELEAG